MKRYSLVAFACAALAAGSAFAQHLPEGPMPPGPPGDRVPPVEVLATAPGLTSAQQEQVRKILIQRRDADDALRDKTRAQMDAIRTQERNEHERIDAQTGDQLRKLLGDDGYRRFAEWSLAHHGPGDGPHGPMPPHFGKPGADGAPRPGGQGQPEPAMPPPGHADQ